MKNRILLPRKAIKDLEHIAKLFFPMEIDAKLSVVKKDEKNFIERIALSNYNYDGRVYEYSEDFDRLINCLRVNNVWEEEINSLIKNKKESQKLFLNYKECQKRRKEGICKRDSIVENLCKECDTYGQPRIRYMYDFSSEKDVFVWHSHVTSKYGCIEKLARPSDADTLILKSRIRKGLPAIGEIVTCTSENGNQLTKAYSIPKKIDDYTRKEILIKKF